MDGPLLLLAMAEGLTGYWLPDDLLSGVSIHIGYSVVLAIPVIGTRVAQLLFGGEFPAPDMLPRFYVFHVLLLPALLLVLVGLHLAIVALQRHTQFPGRGRTEGNVVGKRFWPQHAFKSVSLLLLVAAVCAGLGGLVQINPVWQSGPSRAAHVTSPAQPDWYLGWVDGLLRLGGPWSFEVFGYTISENFWPAILFPAVAFGVLTLWPWIERRFTGDRVAHHLLDRPRDAPAHTATGLAGLVLFVIPFLAGSGDVLAVLLNVPVETITQILRFSFFVAPVLTWLDPQGLLEPGGPADRLLMVVPPRAQSRRRGMGTTPGVTAGSISLQAEAAPPAHAAARWWGPRGHTSSPLAAPSTPPPSSGCSAGRPSRRGVDGHARRKGSLWRRQPAPGLGGRHR